MTIYLKGFSRKPGFRMPASFPFTTGLVKKTKALAFESPVTFFVGENGTGKSTVLEGLAAALSLPALGSRDVARDESLDAARRLAGSWRLAKARAFKAGFFFRAEDYFGYM